MKEMFTNNHINTKNHKRIVRTIMWQQIRQPRRNDKFLEIYIFQDWIEKIDNLNRSITRTKIKSVIKTLSTNRSPGPNNLSGEFYQT